MDREFDNQAIIEHLCHHQEEPKFIIRAKHLNREFEEGKLTEIPFPKADIFKIQELEIKGKKHQNLTLKLSHKKLTLTNKYGEKTQVTIIKSKLLNSQKQPIFQSKKRRQKR